MFITVFENRLIWGAFPVTPTPPTRLVADARVFRPFRRHELAPSVNVRCHRAKSVIVCRRHIRRNATPMGLWDCQKSNIMPPSCSEDGGLRKRPLEVRCSAAALRPHKFFRCFDCEKNIHKCYMWVCSEPEY